MRKNTLLLLFFISSSICCFSQNQIKNKEFYKEITFLNQKSDSLTINDITKLYDQGNFNVPFGNEVFYDLKNTETTWLHYKVKANKSNSYFIIWNPFLEYGKVYFRNTKIDSLKTFTLLNDVDLDWKYRVPTWKLPKSENGLDLFIKIKDNREKTTLKFLFLSEYDFLLFSQIDYAVIALQTGILMVLIIIVIFLFRRKSKKTIVWYGLYIIFCLIEFLLYKGLDLQFGYGYSAVFQSSKRILFQSLGLMSLMFFFSNFYPFDKSTQLIKRIFLYIGYSALAISIVFIIQYIANYVYIPKAILYTALRVFAITILICHLILILKKKLPIYLGIAFLLPICGFFIFYVFGSPKQTLSLAGSFLIDNIYPFMVTIEMSLILYYIVDNLVKSEFLAIKLKNENLELRNNFQDNLLEVQHKERNSLVNNVHDTFGGYLEALKLRLLHKNESTPKKIEEILDSFYKDYRYLLNSLYAPKINSENFVESLTEFSVKLDKLVDQKIHYNFKIENTNLAQEKCLNIYRIISELTTNAIKHANCKDIFITLTQENNTTLVLKVKDNGAGINNTKKLNFGLKSVRSRVEKINGNLEILNNNGAEFLIKIPTNN